MEEKKSDSQIEGLPQKADWEQEKKQKVNVDAAPLDLGARISQDNAADDPGSAYSDNQTLLSP